MRQHVGMPGGVYGGLAAEERREVRRQQLLDAALELLGTDGWQAATVRAICARARLTPRYFYESFPDREALLLAVFDQVAAEAAGVILAAVGAAPADARAKARAAIGAFVELIGEDRRKARVLFIEAMGSEVLTRRRFETLRLFAGLVAGQGREFYGLAAGHEDLVQMSSLMLVGGLAETLLAWLDGTLAVSREQLVADAADLFVATGEAAVALARGRR